MNDNAIYVETQSLAKLSSALLKALPETHIIKSKQCLLPTLAAFISDRCKRYVQIAKDLNKPFPIKVKLVLNKESATVATIIVKIESSEEKRALPVIPT